MNTKWHSRLGILSLVVAIALSMGIYANGVMAQTGASKKTVQVALGLDTNSTTEDELFRDIKLQLRSRGVAFKEPEVRTAARNALNLIAKEKDPLKGVIYIKTKKFTICISWGSDKGFCKSH